jgi:hypothetical protein
MLNEVKCPTKKVFFFNLKNCIFFSGTVSRDVFYRNRSTRLIRPESVRTDVKELNLSSGLYCSSSSPNGIAKQDRDCM